MHDNGKLYRYVLLATLDLGGGGVGGVRPPILGQQFCKSTPPPYPLWKIPGSALGMVFAFSLFKNIQETSWFILLVTIL